MEIGFRLCQVPGSERPVSSTVDTAHKGYSLRSLATTVQSHTANPFYGCLHESCEVREVTKMQHKSVVFNANPRKRQTHQQDAVRPRQRLVMSVRLFALPPQPVQL